MDPIQDDDGDPAWETIGAYNDIFQDDHVNAIPDVWRPSPSGELFIDFPHPFPRYAEGEVIRIRSKTLSPAMLRSYRLPWLRLKTRYDANSEDNYGGGEQGADSRRGSADEKVRTRRQLWYSRCD